MKDNTSTQQVREASAAAGLDLTVAQAIFHEQNERSALGCTHQNQYASGQECGREAIEFAQEYIRRQEENNG